MIYTPKVALTRCRDYGPELEAALRRVLKPLGGMAAFVKPGNSVLIKPNMLSDRTPDEAITTHPEVVRALIRLVREAGGVPSVADSPASAIKTERVWDRTGFAALCDAEKVPLLNLEKSGSIPFEHRGCRFNIAQPVLDADRLINVPKVKTHVLTTLTAGVKNLYGCIPGYHKTQLHRDFPRPQDFGKLMAAAYEQIQVSLTVADGIVGMQGDGPAGGFPLPLGILAASPDAVALDYMLCDLLGIDPRAVPYLPVLAATAPAFDMVGTPIDELRPGRVKLPGTFKTRLIPSGLVRLIEPLLWIRPQIKADECIRCGKCVKACPVEALSMEANTPPALSPRTCIGCCCCHEVCPEKAIDMTSSRLVKLFGGSSLP